MIDLIGLRLDAGGVFFSDTRINAGRDRISHPKKGTV